MDRRTFLWGMVGVLLVATALRLVSFGQVPPGLYHDEAYHGLDALAVLRGDLSLYFPANNGREPLFIYLIAGTVGLLGRSPFSLRLVAFPVGLFTVAATAVMGRVLFSRRVGLLAAGVLAVTLWPVHLSRVGFRAVLLPLFIALVIWAGGMGVRTGRRRYWIAAGLLYGLSFYTYTAARLTPAVLLLFGAYLLAMQGRRLPLRSLSVALITALLVLLPLGVYAGLHPDVVLARPGQVSILDPAINSGDLWGTLGRHLLQAAGMFFVRGDRIPRHNVPWRPVFDPLLGAAFLLGLVAALRRAQRDPAAGLLLIWSAVMLLPTVLAEDTPHFLRAVGLLPVIVLFPALGLERMLSARPGKVHPFLAALVAGILLFGLGSTVAAYLGGYARDPVTGYWFEEGTVALVARINEVLGVGWTGEGMAQGEATDRTVYLDRGLWEKWPQLRFLVAAPDEVRVGLEGDPAEGAVAIFAWPYGDWQRAWSLLPAPAEVSVREGPLSQGDRDPEPYVTYLAFFADPVGPAPAPRARFSGGVALLDVETTCLPPDRLRVRLRWRADGPLSERYTVFLHYLRDGEGIAQADGPPAAGYYPTTVWRPGDVVVDDHYVVGIGEPLPGRDLLRIGLWRPETGETLPRLDEAGDWVLVPVTAE